MNFDDLKLGMTVTTEPARIDMDKLKSFAADYDHIPLHTDEEYAKTTIFGGLIAPGVMSFMAVWSKYLDKDFFGKELLAGKSTKIEWLKPVYPEDELTGIMTITNLTKRSEKNGIVEISADVYNKKGELVLQAVTEAIVNCRPSA
jgi:acyl dehydratase